MTIILQKMIFRSDLTSNPSVLYVFGDNTVRKGLGGQAKEMRFEKNAVGVATKYAPGMLTQDFFREEPQAIEAQKRIIDGDMKPLFAHVKKGGVVVWPADGIGTGLSALPTYSPTTYDYIESKLAALCQMSALFLQNRQHELRRLGEAHGV